MNDEQIQSMIDTLPLCQRRTGLPRRRAMTQADADRLKEQLDSLTLAQWKLFWRWITYAYFDRCRQGR